MGIGLWEIVFILTGILPWLLVFGASVYLIRLWKRPGPEQLQRAEVDELREQVSLMRDFVRDAMERIRRLEEGRGEEGRLPPGGVGGLGAGPETPEEGDAAPRATPEGPPRREGPAGP